MEAISHLPAKALALLLCIFAALMLPAYWYGSDWIIPMATAVYVLMTGWLAIEAHNQRRITARPMVDAYIDSARDESGKRNLWVVVSNHGLRPATDIAFCWQDKMTVAFEDGNSHILQDRQPMLKEIAFMPPQHEIRSGLTFGAEIDKVSPSVSKGKVSYRDAETGETYATSIALDVEHLKEITWFTSSRDNELAQVLRSIRDELKGIKREVSKPQVATGATLDQ